MLSVSSTTASRNANFIRRTFRFSGGALPHVPWHFIHHRPLQPVVRPLARVCHRTPGLSLQIVNVNAEANVDHAKYGYSKTAATMLMR